MPTAYDMLAPFPRTVARRRRERLPMPQPQAQGWEPERIADGGTADEAQAHTHHLFEADTEAQNEPYWATWGF